MYYLYKLKFPYGVHFGADKVGIGLEKISMNCHCDTFFSALCHEVLKLYGEEKLKNFIKATTNGEFLFSDLLPYTKNDLLIPKPILYTERSRNDKQEDEISSIKKKQIKKMEFLSISKLEEYFSGNPITTEFAQNMVYDKCSPARTGEKENGLYSVAVTRFDEDCGLYFVVQMAENEKEWFDNVLKSLSYSGIGGKRTSGYGRFNIVEEGVELDESSGILYEKTLAKMLNEEAEYYLSLSSFLPQKDEISKLKDGYYSLIKRSGFVSSTTYADNLLKKVPLVMVKAGSCFKEKLQGDIVDVQNQGDHPVYRYGKPIMIGIK